MTRVLHVSHTGLLSGAEHSLLELLGQRAAHGDSALACPACPLAARAGASGSAVRPIPDSQLTFRPHPVLTPRALGLMAAAAVAVRRAAVGERAEVVHANSVRAGLIALLAQGLEPVGLDFKLT